MWILEKHPSTKGSDDERYYLLGGRAYVIGRKSCDIVIPGDISISRKHARISVQRTNHNDPEQSMEKLSIMDTSKTGVQVNGSKITPNVEEKLKDGDLIKVGCQNTKFKLTYQRLVVLTSCVNTSTSKAMVKMCIEKLGGVSVPNWSDKATHLVMEKLTFTIKVVCAMACGKPIVSVKYLEDLLDCCDKKTGLPLPNVKDYLPPISEQTLISNEPLFQPNDKRKSLMAGKLLIVLVDQQFNRVKDAVQFAGGQVVLKDTKDAKLVNHISSNQTIVLQVEKKDEKHASASQTNWIKEIYAKLKMLKLRPIRESEIGLAILNVSLEKYCNPTLNAAPAISGSSHTQVIQDSFCATQQTQVLTENINATQALDETQDIQLHESVSVAPNENVDIIPKKLPDVGNVSVDVDMISTTVRRKRPISSENNADSGQKNLHDFFKKPKLKEDNNSHGSLITKNDDNVMTADKTNPKVVTIDSDENEDEAHKLPVNDTKNDDKPGKRKNIINIEDDDDEDDVFSFNFSKPCVPFSAKTPDVETYSASLQKSEETSLVLDEPSNVPKTTGQSYIPTTHELESPSGVLFTPLSKKAVSDSYLPSSNPPLSGKRIPETYLPSAVTPLKVNPGLDTTSCVPESCPSFLKKNISDEDDDDDPFSFSVGISAPMLSKLKGKNIKKKENAKTKDLDSSKLNTGGEGCNETDKLASDSDESFTRSSTDDGKQKSRFVKAISSSQCSEAEEVFISDGEGHLVTKDSTSGKDSKPKDVDMSYLLDDDYDDELDLVSKEYSMQKDSQENHVALKGFISSLNKRPKVNVKEEDQDLIGIDTSKLVQIKFASLVKKDSEKKAPRKTGNIPGSKLKNHKIFKKQRYAGMNVQTRVISKHNFEVFESDNIERANLFSDIREKDAEEAEENRRIDKMFDVMSSSKKTKK